MKAFVQVYLLLWFFVLSLFIFVPSFTLLGQHDDTAVATKPLPSPPQPPTAPKPDNSLQKKERQQRYSDDIAVYTQEVVAYAQQVSAYREHLSAYKAAVESPLRSSSAQRYSLVVKDTLLSLCTAVITALLGYVFIKAGARIIDNHIRATHGKDVHQFDF